MGQDNSRRREINAKVRRLAKTPVRERVSPEEWAVRADLVACFDFMCYLERACQAQIGAMAGGQAGAARLPGDGAGVQSAAAHARQDGCVVQGLAAASEFHVTSHASSITPHQ
jgi:hypothetical protein